MGFICLLSVFNGFRNRSKRSLSLVRLQWFHELCRCLETCFVQQVEEVKSVNTSSQGFSVFRNVPLILIGIAKPSFVRDDQRGLDGQTFWPIVVACLLVLNCQSSCLSLLSLPSSAMAVKRGLCLLTLERKKDQAFKTPVCGETSPYLLPEAQVPTIGCGTS